MLFAAYAATLGVDAGGGSAYAGAEPHFLVAAASLADGGDLDLADEYAAGLGDRWAPRAATAAREQRFEGARAVGGNDAAAAGRERRNEGATSGDHAGPGAAGDEAAPGAAGGDEAAPGAAGGGGRAAAPGGQRPATVERGVRPLVTDGRLVRGRLVEPHGIGFPLLIAPAYALGGNTLVVALLAAIAALAFVLGAALARRVVPDPWATWAALVAGLSPPALANATAVLPALTAGALLAAAALCALAVRERPLMRYAYGGAALLAVLPWLDPWLLVPAAPVATLLARWTSRRGRRLVALATLEVQLASLVFYVSLNEQLYGGFTPLVVGDGSATGATSLGDYAGRLPRLVSLWLDRDAGLLRWAPVIALAFVGAWLLWRSRRDRLARIVAEQRDAEHAAFVALAVCAGQVAVATFLAPALDGPWFPGTQLVAALPCAVPLLAWGLRRMPRAGVALGALTVAASLWLALTATWAPPDSDAPWGPLVVAFPLAAALALAASVGVAWWRERRELRL